jgi:MarR family transcriptional regulator, 2-MHQ and catechol-resistance regulon repressor
LLLALEVRFWSLTGTISGAVSAAVDDDSFVLLGQLRSTASTTRKRSRRRVPATAFSVRRVGSRTSDITTTNTPAASHPGLTTSDALFRILNIVATKARQQLAPPTEGDRAATLQLIIALGRALQAIERGVRPHLVECGLSMTEFAVLEVLYHKGALPLGEIRDRILLTGASTTYVVKKLEERGLMRRRVCTEDQRIVFGELTAKGRALIDEVFPAHVERLRDVTAGLSVSEKREVSRLLHALSLHARRTTGEKVTEDD